MGFNSGFKGLITLYRLQVNRLSNNIGRWSRIDAR